MLTGFQDFLTKSNRIYLPGEIEEMIATVRPNFRFSRSRKIRYFNVPSAYDIETSSFYRLVENSKRMEKCAVMYEWTFGLYGLVMIGRTWEEFINVINTLSQILDLNDEKRLIIGVHNLAYEFQFMRKWLEWEKVFAIETRKPIYALTVNGIEFRCTYLLTGYKLETVAKNLQTYELKKRVGDLDYSKLRLTITPLTDEETDYCVDDVKIVMADLAERIETAGGIARLPLTKTGYVRNYCRKACFGEL